MATRDPRIDAYIEASADFAQPIMNHLRELVHQACPTVEEGMKWSFPHFMYAGRILCSMAAFKQHCAFGFWHPEMRTQLGEKGEQAMGQFGRITGLEDLPKDRETTRYIRRAMELIDATNAAPPKPRAKNDESKELTIPDDLAAALRKNRQAGAAFRKLSYSHRKEYVEWITEAKREETRTKRLETAIEWIAEGKPRHWQYQKK